MKNDWLHSCTGCMESKKILFPQMLRTHLCQSIKLWKLNYLQDKYTTVNKVYFSSYKGVCCSKKQNLRVFLVFIDSISKSFQTPERLSAEKSICVSQVLAHFEMAKT